MSDIGFSPVQELAPVLGCDDVPWIKIKAPKAVGDIRRLEEPKSVPDVFAQERQLFSAESAWSGFGLLFHEPVHDTQEGVDQLRYSGNSQIMRT